MGCRERTAQAALLRVVAVEDQLVLDTARRLPGRGAHLHPDLRCLDLAEKRRAFPRALRLTGPLDASALRSAVTEQGSQGPIGASTTRTTVSAPEESRHR